LTPFSRTFFKNFKWPAPFILQKHVFSVVINLLWLVQ
jgi:hypothetical protein